jgi:hypothetical protein
MAPSQAGLLVILNSLQRGTPRGVQTPYVHQPMSSYHLLLVLDAIPSWEGATPFSGVMDFIRQIRVRLP